MAVPHVLVVDDCNFHRMLNSAAVRAVSAKPVQACNNNEALAQLGGPDSMQISAVVTDLMMERETSGFELIKAIREKHEHANTPIFLVTSNDAAKELARLPGPNHFVSKSEGSAALRAVLLAKVPLAKPRAGRPVGVNGT